MAFALTYNSLIEQMPSYMERSDAKYLAQIPALVTYAENRLAADMKQQGFQSVVRGNFTAGNNVVAKPAFWRETISFTFRNASGAWVPISLRALEYIKNIYTLSSDEGNPRFYADYNAQNFMFGPAPDDTYEFELIYYARLQPLDASNQVNWLTANAPQTLLYACILESHLWAKNMDKASFWQQQYENQKGSILGENQEHLADRGEVVSRG